MFGNTFFFSSSSFDSDAQAYITAVETADGQALESAVKTAINNFVVGCKIDGVWNAIKSSCIMAGARTLSGALVPLKGTAPTNFNFVGGDYNRKTGLVGNGTSKYLNSNRNNNADPQNSHHIAVFLTSVDTTSAINPAFIGTGGGTSDSVIGYAINTTGTYFIRSRSSAALESLTISRATGLHAISRESNSLLNVKVPGFSSTGTLTSEVPRSSNIKVFGRDTAVYSNARISFYSIGEHLNLSQLDTRVSTLMTTFNTVIV